MARALWKGAIAFGLVHLPVALFSATRDSRVDFQWLDRKSLDPVGYKRYNKRTGRELKIQDIVKGVRQPNGKYVVVTDDEIRAAFPTSTQTIEITSFVKITELPLMMLERPYYVQPAARADKVYALLREAMRDAGVAALARIVIHNKEHFAAVLVVQDALVLEVLRWAADLRPTSTVDLPGRAAAAVTGAELKMASRLIDEMTRPWKPQHDTGHFSKAIGTLVRRKLAAGKATTVEPLEQAPQAQTPSNVIDLAQLLRDSMRARRKPGGRRTASPARTAARARHG
jgi:DNA end-binding protein Ku